MNRKSFIFGKMITISVLFFLSVIENSADAKLILQSRTRAVSMELKNADIQDVEAPPTCFMCVYLLYYQ